MCKLTAVPFQVIKNQAQSSSSVWQQRAAGSSSGRTTTAHRGIHDKTRILRHGNVRQWARRLTRTATVIGPVQAATALACMPGREGRPQPGGSTPATVETLASQHGPDDTSRAFCRAFADANTVDKLPLAGPETSRTDTRIDKNRNAAGHLGTMLTRCGLLCADPRG